MRVREGRSGRQFHKTVSGSRTKKVPAVESYVYSFLFIYILQPGLPDRGGNKMASISLKDVNKVYPNGVHAVIDFNMEIADQEFIIFVGPSGCGKTTTLRMIAGLEDITSGAFGLKLHKVPRKEIDRAVREAARILDLTELLNRKPKALSGGQKQRVAMGRAIVRKPKVFLMDEPLSNLDAKLRVQMRAEIAKLHQRLGTTIIYVTHDQTEAMTLGTRIVVMKDGVVQQIDSPQNLYEKPCNLFVAGFMGSPQMNFLDATVRISGARAFLELEGQSIPLPEEKAKPLIDGEWDGRSVILGIRPEDIFEKKESFAFGNQGFDFQVTCDVYELLGAEVFLYFELGSSAVTARVESDTRVRPGDKLTVSFDIDKIHIFDKDTEEAIAN